MELYLKEKLYDYYKDPLTNLDNRFALMEYLKLNSRVNVFVINLDNFASINNAYGYLTGDEILCEVANYLNLMKKKISSFLDLMVMSLCL
ncbi:MAG: diguanylate cyclase [Campylobacterota bacterium]|nr:diguanylate cyclase [Campylobacterota bacterium]